MKVQKIFFLIFISLIVFQSSFSQEFIDGENWIGKIEGANMPYLHHRLVNYTKDDVIKSKQKLNSIKQTQTQNEWEGEYSNDGELTENRLFWKTQIGFVTYSIYTCAIELRRLDFGVISNTSSDAVRFKSEKPNTGKAKTNHYLGNNFVKVKVGERHFLVPEKDLSKFTQYAVGLSLENYPFSFTFWRKVEDSVNSSSNILVLPARFSSYLRQPITGEIAAIGKREVIQSPNSEGKIETDAVNYEFTLDKGRNVGVKKGMQFYVLEMKEWASVEKTSDKTSVAVIQRPFENNSEICRDENFEEHSCNKLSIGMNLKTWNSNL